MCETCLQRAYRVPGDFCILLNVKEQTFKKNVVQRIQHPTRYRAGASLCHYATPI